MIQLLCLGFGPMARAIIAELQQQHRPLSVAWTNRSGLSEHPLAGIARGFVWRRETPLSLPEGLETWARGSTHWLISVPPDLGMGEDSAVAWWRYLASTGPLACRWIGYLSSTAVYGDWGGRWVDEMDTPRPSSQRGIARLAVERQWQAVAPGLFHGFRLAGLYGMERNALQRRISVAQERPGHVFSRIMVEDAALGVAASMLTPTPSCVYNMADDTPSSYADVVTEAARLMGWPLPERLLIDANALDAESFYAESKRVRALQIRQRFGIGWRHPSFREGLQSIYTQTFSRKEKE